MSHEWLEQVVVDPNVDSAAEERARLGPVPRGRRSTVFRWKADEELIAETHPDGKSKLKDPGDDQLRKVRDEILPQVTEQLSLLSDARAEALLEKYGLSMNLEAQAEKTVKDLLHRLNEFPCSVEWSATLEARGLRWTRPPLRSKAGLLNARLQSWTEDSPSAADSSLFSSTGIWRSPNGKWIFMLWGGWWFLALVLQVHVHLTLSGVQDVYNFYEEPPDVRRLAQASPLDNATLDNNNVTDVGAAASPVSVALDVIRFVLTAELCLVNWAIAACLSQGRAPLAMRLNAGAATSELIYALSVVVLNAAGGLGYHAHIMAFIVIAFGLFLPGIRFGLHWYKTLSFYFVYIGFFFIGFAGAIMYSLLYGNPFAVNWMTALEYVVYLAIMVVTIVMGIVLFRRRRLALRESRLIRAQESKRYSKVWERLCRTEGFQEGLVELEQAWAALQKKADQAGGSRGGKEQDARLRFLGHTGVEALFHQADEVNPLLQALGHKWAHAAGGVHHAAGVKAEERALQKVFRSYEGKWTKLCDLSRTSIVFDTPQQVARCLREIASDPEVAVIRKSDAKCRLRTDFDAERLSGGYRDVQLSMRLVGKEAVERGCEGHVVEVQLHLKSIFDIKTAEGHAAYVRARNLASD